MLLLLLLSRFVIASPEVELPPAVKAEASRSSVKSDQVAVAEKGAKTGVFPTTIINSVVLVQQGPGYCAGVRIDSKGHLATAYHCIAGGGRILLKNRLGEEAYGSIVSVDVQKDLAVLLAPQWAHLPHLQLREDVPTQGEIVYAIGHPYASLQEADQYKGLLQWSISKGIVSARNRNWIQTDAAVNPGSSGGPLVDSNGRVLGIASRKLNAEGISFFSRSNHVSPLVNTPNGLPFYSGTLQAQVGYDQLFNGDGALSLRLAAILRGLIHVDGAVNWGLGSDRMNLTNQTARPLARFGLGLGYELGSGANWIQLSGGGSLSWFEDVLVQQQIQNTAIEMNPGLYVALEYRGIRIQWSSFLGADRGNMLSFGILWPGTIAVF